VDGPTVQAPLLAPHARRHRACLSPFWVSRDDHHAAGLLLPQRTHRDL